MHPDEPFSCRGLRARPASPHQSDQPHSLMPPKSLRRRSVIKAHLKVLSSAIVALCSKRLARASWSTGRLALQVGVNFMPRKQTETGALCFVRGSTHQMGQASRHQNRLSTVGAVDLRDIQRVSITDSELVLFYKSDRCACRNCSASVLLSLCSKR